MEYTKIPNIFKREEFGKNLLIEGEFSSDELEFLADNLWVWTEKVDGTNIRVIMCRQCWLDWLKAPVKEGE